MNSKLIFAVALFAVLAYSTAASNPFNFCQQNAFSIQNGGGDCKVEGWNNRDDCNGAGTCECSPDKDGNCKGTCACDGGRSTGSKCGKSVRGLCNDHGAYDGTRCVCDGGYTGNKCSIEAWSFCRNVDTGVVGGNLNLSTCE
eukprot:Nk52_evm1s1214 gene=Nk52_evmTU1s1214